MLSLSELKNLIEKGEIHTVVVGAVDMQGRLVGKRIHGPFYLADTINNGTEGCNYLLAVDADMNTIQGYDFTSWDKGYGDMVMTPEKDRFQIIDWHDGSVFVIADLNDHHGHGIKISPRQILKNQLEKLKENNLQALCGTELEFIVFEDSYEAGFKNKYQNLTPVNLYNVDYSLLGTGRVEGLLKEIRLGMANAGLVVESVKGECNFGQHEIAFRYKDALSTCDDHSLYKLGAKEIAAKLGYSLTFMAKFNEREGNSCHIHLSFRDLLDNPILAGEGRYGLSEAGESFIAGIQKHMKELTLLFAPNINSYKRYQPDTFAPTAIKWGPDNRTCALRLVGHGKSLRLENRVPGGDVNPYLAVAGMIAAGLDGMKNKLVLEDPLLGNAYTSESERVPTTLLAAHKLFSESAWIKETFGDEVQKHYSHMAEVEIDAFNRAVTDWERVRGFERF